MAIRGKSNMVPLDRLVSEVFAAAKQDLNPGDTLDGIGGCASYCLIDRFETASTENLLPAGIAKNATVIRPVAKDVPLTYDDVQLSEPSAIIELRRIQDQWMSGEIGDQQMLDAVDAMKIV